jgi:hypothetical protein
MLRCVRLLLSLALAVDALLIRQFTYDGQN